MASFLTLSAGIPILQNVAGIGAAYEQSATLSVDQTGAFTLPNSQTFNLGNNELQIWVDGVRQAKTLDFTETSTTSVTFTKTIKAGQTILIRR